MILNGKGALLSLPIISLLTTNEQPDAHRDRQPLDYHCTDLPPDLQFFVAIQVLKT